MCFPRMDDNLILTGLLTTFVPNFQVLGTHLQKPQSATDQLLLAMQSAAANSAAKVGISGAGVLGGGLVTSKPTVLASSE